MLFISATTVLVQRAFTDVQSSQYSLCLFIDFLFESLTTGFGVGVESLVLLADFYLGETPDLACVDQIIPHDPVQSLEVWRQILLVSKKAFLTEEVVNEELLKYAVVLSVVLLAHRVGLVHFDQVIHLVLVAVDDLFDVLAELLLEDGMWSYIAASVCYFVHRLSCHVVFSPVLPSVHVKVFTREVKAFAKISHVDWNAARLSKDGFEVLVVARVLEHLANHVLVKDFVE
jgi:hypothetical protein